jgi:hypothetical protein
MDSEKRKRACRGCLEKQAIIDNLLDRLSAVRSEAPQSDHSVFDQMLDQLEGSAEERLANEMKSVEAAKLFSKSFREMHTSSPYANCRIETEKRDA